MCRSYHVTFAQPFNTHDDEDDDESRATLFIHPVGSVRESGGTGTMDMDQGPQPGQVIHELVRVDLDISFVFVANLTRSLFS